MLERDVPPGKKLYLSIEKQEELKRIILESTPSQERMGVYASWDSRILQQFISQKWGIFMNRGGIIHMLQRLNLSYTRPTYTLAKADKEKQEAFTKQLDRIKKRFTDDMILLYEDESHIRSYQALRSTWPETGKTAIVCFSCSYRRIHLN
ncbi:winged helix-turn-helix domain-containing protein [Aneurinibacillus aneurinilyticus]|uniref:winged helix-turn-helix domain-containing protein n=1 Tax=Aneurinibacillus aneurinilyticus TaxID=1391 RepID=UPI003C6C9674